MNAVVTLAIGEHFEKLAKITHPSIKDYAEKIGAEFICISEQKISQTTPHWEKFQLASLLTKYKRIIFVDTDIIIREDCPDLFEEVPKEQLGVFNEGAFIVRDKSLMEEVFRAYGIHPKKWDGSYYNTGVMVLSRKHRALFKKPKLEYCHFYEQSYLNMAIAVEETPVYNLPYRFNRMCCMDRVTGEERFDSSIIHYAGQHAVNDIFDLIPKDLAQWEADKENNYSYQSHIFIEVNGGLGDQICAEPAIRYMRQKFYPEDDFIVATHFPRLFDHFKALGIKVYEHGSVQASAKAAYYEVNTLPGPETIQWAIVSHLLCHMMDYAAIALVKRTLPYEHKQIQFKLEPGDFEDLSDLIEDKDFSNMVVIHPGKHWESKTFPVEYWQSIIDGLSANGKVVCLIGKEQPGDPPDYIQGARGTVPVNCPQNGIDLRDITTLGSMAALISKAPILVSNDSAPIHLAGAFDNYIILIPSCKDPSYVLPFRNGTVWYKSKALYSHLLVDDVESKPTQVYSTSVDIKNIDWDKHLLPPEEIVQEILNCPTD